MPHYTALVSLLAIALYFFIATRVAAAHRKFGVKLPAMTGNLAMVKLLLKHGATPLDKSGVVVVLQRTGDLDVGREGGAP